MTRLLLVVISLSLAGCAATPQQVSVPCLKSIPEKPEYRFGSGPKPKPEDAVRILALDFEAADKYASAWEAAATGCVVLMKSGESR